MVSHNNINIDLPVLIPADLVPALSVAALTQRHLHISQAINLEQRGVSSQSSSHFVICSKIIHLVIIIGYGKVLLLLLPVINVVVQSVGNVVGDRTGSEK